MEFLMLLAFTLYSAAADSDAVEKRLLEHARGLKILALGERHGSIIEHAFLSQLVRDKEFSSVFSMIVVEYGNALYQKIMDRYLSGESVPPEDLAHVWRNTTVPMAWDSPLYSDFFQQIRDINKRLPKSKQIQVLLGDPPVNWSRVNNVADFAPYMDRDAFYAKVVEQNCASQRCLLICGTNHLYWKDPLAGQRPPSKHKNTLEYYLEATGSRDKVEVVLPVFSQDKTVAANGVPSLTSTHTPPLANLRFGEVEQSRVRILKKVDGELRPVEVQPENTLAVSDVVDWVLYLGPSDKKADAPASLYRDRAYVKELYRRVKITSDAFGFDMTDNVKAIDPDLKHD